MTEEQKAHRQLLIQMAVVMASVDGNLDEYEALADLAMKYGFDSQVVQELRSGNVPQEFLNTDGLDESHLSTYKALVSREEKAEFIFDLLGIADADGEMNKEEVVFFAKIAQNMGFEKDELC